MTPTSAHIRDPVNGDRITFIDENAEKIAALHLELARRHWLTIREVYRMVRVALFGAVALDDDFHPFEEFEELKHDNDRLAQGALAIDDLLDIRERARKAVAIAARCTRDPVERAKLEAMLAHPTPEWQRVQRIARRLRARHAERKGRLQLVRSCEAKG